MSFTFTLLAPLLVLHTSKQALPTLLKSYRVYRILLLPQSCSLFSWGDSDPEIPQLLCLVIDLLIINDISSENITRITRSVTVTPDIPARTGGELDHTLDVCKAANSAKYRKYYHKNYLRIYTGFTVYDHAVSKPSNLLQLEEQIKLGSSLANALNITL